MNKGFLIVAILSLTILSSCKDDTPTVDVPPDPPKITVDSPWQYSIKIDGTAYTAKEGIQDYLGAYSTSGFVAPFPDTSALIYQSGLADSLNTNSLFITKGTLRFASGTIPVDTLFEAFFAPGNYSYSHAALNGIIIEWYDLNGQKWSTDLGTAIQSGSGFVITDTKPTYINGYLDLRLKATFNCKLYNSSGQSKTLTDGVYVGSFEAI